MNKFVRDIIEVIIVGVLVGLVGIFGVLQYQKIENREKIKNEEILNLNNAIIVVAKEVTNLHEYINSMFYLSNKIDNSLIDCIKVLNKNINNLPNKIILDRLSKEKNLQQVTVMIKNATVGALGSGVTIKYRGKFYILSAGHMANVVNDNINPQDEIELWENDNKVCDLEIIKHEFTTPEESEKGDFTMGTDLILLKPKNPYIMPKYYTELADTEVSVGTEVYIVGNPMGMEDVISDGRVVIYKNNFMYYIDHTYFGNSGGGTYTHDGKLVGIVSHMYPIQPMADIPPYVINGAVRLEVIKKFLKDIK